MKKHLFLFTFLTLLSTISIAQELSTDIFKPLEDPERKPWEIHYQDHADLFDSIYTTYSEQQDFEVTLLEFLKKLNDNNLSNYRWIGSFLMDSTYSKVINLDLSIIVLESGLEEVERRIAEREEPSFDIQVLHCELLWVNGYYHFRTDNPKKGAYYFDLATSYDGKPQCMLAKPALKEEEWDAMYATYQQYRKK